MEAYRLRHSLYVVVVLMENEHENWKMEYLLGNLKRMRRKSMIEIRDTNLQHFPRKKIK